MCRAWARAATILLKQWVVVGPRELETAFVWRMKRCGVRASSITIMGDLDRLRVGPEDAHLSALVAENVGLREFYAFGLDDITAPHGSALLPATLERLHIEDWVLSGARLAWMMTVARPRHLWLNSRALMAPVSGELAEELAVSVGRLRSLFIDVKWAWAHTFQDASGTVHLDEFEPAIAQSLAMALITPVAKALQHFGADGLTQSDIGTLRAHGLGAALETLSLADGGLDDTVPEGQPPSFFADTQLRSESLRRVLGMMTPRIKAIHLAFDLHFLGPADRLAAWRQLVDGIVGKLERGELPALREVRFDRMLGAVPSAVGLREEHLGSARAYVRARLRLVELCEERRISWRFTSDR